MAPYLWRWHTILCMALCAFHCARTFVVNVCLRAFPLFRSLTLTPRIYPKAKYIIWTHGLIYIVIPGIAIYQVSQIIYLYNIMRIIQVHHITYQNGNSHWSKHWFVTVWQCFVKQEYFIFCNLSPFRPVAVITWSKRLHLTKFTVFISWHLNNNYVHSHFGNSFLNSAGIILQAPSRWCRGSW